MSGRSGMLMGHPTLNANVRAAGDALAQAGLLAEFHTTLDTTALLRALGRSALGGAFTRRPLPDAVHRLARTHPASELRRLATQRFGVGINPGVYPVDTSSFAVDRAVRARITSQATGIHAYEDGALFSFRQAAEFGIPRIHDLPIGYWRAEDEIYAEQAELQPGWAGTITARAIANREGRQERKDSEIALATRIIVASSFTRQTFSRFFGSLPDLAPIVSIPYGVPAVVDVPNFSSAGPLRVLYVGGLTQRKGTSYLFDAARALGPAVELTVVGRRVGESVARDLALSSLRWIESLAQAKLVAADSAFALAVFAPHPVGDAIQTSEVAHGPFLISPTVRPLIPRSVFQLHFSARAYRELGAQVSRVDLIHLSLSRELFPLVALRSALRSGWPVIVQPHGMLTSRTSLIHRFLDLFVKRLYRDANLVVALTRSRDFVIPAFMEPWGNVLVTALTIGVPTIVSRSAALASDIALAKVGLVVDDGDSDAIANAVHEVLELSETDYVTFSDHCRAYARDTLGNQAVRSRPKSYCLSVFAVGRTTSLGTD